MNIGVSEEVKTYCRELEETGFLGDIKQTVGQRFIHATDNSIYQKIPKAVLYPKATEDIMLALRHSYFGKQQLSFTAQGGSTGTVGQSLSDAMIVDCSRYMNRVREINTQEGWVEVEAGTTLKQLNVALDEMGFEFLVQISPADRATIGGMVATNAAGPGSFEIGRMSSQVISCEIVLATGELIDTGKSYSQSALFKAHQALVNIDQKVNQELKERKADCPRNIGGYDVQSCLANPSIPNYSSLICGSEGSLGIVTKVRLKIQRKSAKVMLVIHSQDRNEALSWREAILSSGASVIEMLDHQLCNLARQHLGGRDASLPWLAEQAGANEILLLIVYEGLDSLELSKRAEAFTKTIEDLSTVSKAFITVQPSMMKQVWAMRKGAVGLMSRVVDRNERRPLAAIEDTAVPPRYLSEYVVALSDILDKYQLFYGMYGHVDAGCIHVRPALNLENIEEQEKLRQLVLEVKLCCESFGGVLWGEHGLGHRTEFASSFWGEGITQVMGKIKAAFDPKGIMNPGKVIADGSVMFAGNWRSDFNGLLGANDRLLHPEISACNGNGACYGDETAVMCPSYRVTRDKSQSPKGRAQMLRLWQILKQSPNTDELAELESELHRSLQSCLGCRACVGECPIAVDIPKAKSVFLNNYHRHRIRSMASRLIVHSERVTGWMIQSPWLARLIFNSFSRQFLSMIGLVDLPEFTGRKWQAWQGQWDCSDKNVEVYLLPDVWTAAYQPKVWLACFQLFSQLGISFKILPPQVLGRSAYVEGAMDLFGKQVKNTRRAVESLVVSNQPILMLEPSMVQSIKDDWPEHNDDPAGWESRILSLETWLLEWLSRHPQRMRVKHSTWVTYLQHCSEQTVGQTFTDWQSVFELFGFRVKVPELGCCGMAGHFGHVQKNQNISWALFDGHWRSTIMHHNDVCGSGYSCRSQAERAGMTLPHPLEWLWRQWQEGVLQPDK